MQVDKYQSQDVLLDINQQMQEDPSTSTVRFNVQNEIGLSDTDKLQTAFEKRLQAPAVTIQRVLNSFTWLFYAKSSKSSKI